VRLTATIADINAAFNAGTLTAENLVQLCLTRIQSYDRQGPSLHAVMAINPKAVETARELDAERKAKGPRSALHGIPVVLKDNYNTADIAGAIILAKVNMSEFALSGDPLGAIGAAPRSSLGIPMTSHGRRQVPLVAQALLSRRRTLHSGWGPIQASIRGPSTANGIVGLKPTHGLLSRSGIIPLALTFDTGGPMARSVSDVAVALGAMTGIDPADAATQKSEGKFSTDYTKDLKIDALKGARIGIARDFLGADPDVDGVIEASLDAMRKAGATIVDVHYPKWLLDSKLEFFNAILLPEFAAQIKDYLATIGPEYPKTIQDMIDRTNRFTAPRADGARPNPTRWIVFKREASSGTLEDYRYTSVRDYGLPLVRAAVEGLFAAEKLDAIVYPTAPRRPALLTAPPDTAPPSPTASATSIASLTGFPDLIVPAGFTGDNLPVGISFFGPAFSEQKLLSLGYSFEQATHARRRPVDAPALKGESISVP
jgi:amidase